MAVTSQLPTISVVLPVYNGAKYLAEALDSILEQSYSDFELIVIDDGSTDESLSILEDYQRQDSRLRLISRENRDLATTLNESIDMARGEWVARMDQDDIALPHRLESQLLWLKKSGADIAGSWVKCFGSWDQRTTKAYRTDQAIKVDMLFKSPFVHPSVMMRTSLVRSLRYDRAAEKAEDYDLWVRAAQAGWIMTNVPEVLLLYRKHSTQISTMSSARQLRVAGEVQARYWASLRDTYQLEQRQVQEVLNLIGSSRRPEMDIVDAVMERLLRANHGEARLAMLDNVSRFYLRVAGNVPDAGARWSRLQHAHGSGVTVLDRIKMWVATVVGIRYGGTLFDFVKKMHSYIFR